MSRAPVSFIRSPSRLVATATRTTPVLLDWWCGPAWRPIGGARSLDDRGVVVRRRAKGLCSSAGAAAVRSEARGRSRPSFPAAWRIRRSARFCPGHLGDGLWPGRRGVPTARGPGRVLGDREDLERDFPPHLLNRARRAAADLGGRGVLILQLCPHGLPQRPGGGGLALRRGRRPRSRCRPSRSPGRARPASPSSRRWRASSQRASSRRRSSSRRAALGRSDPLLVGAGALGPGRQLHRRRRGCERGVLDADLVEVGAGARAGVPGRPAPAQRARQFSMRTWSSHRPDRSAATADTRPALCRAPLTTSPLADRPGGPPRPEARRGRGRRAVRPRESQVRTPAQVSGRRPRTAAVNRCG